MPLVEVSDRSKRALSGNFKIRLNSKIENGNMVMMTAPRVF